MAFQKYPSTIPARSNVRVAANVFSKKMLMGTPQLGILGSPSCWQTSLGRHHLETCKCLLPLGSAATHRDEGVEGENVRYDL